MSEENMDLFNQAVGKILRLLYESHPKPTELDGFDLAEVPNIAKVLIGIMEGPETLTTAESQKESLYSDTITWLEDNGFIRVRTYPFYTLTVEGLDLMNKPLSLEDFPNQTIGESLVKTARAGALGAVSTILKAAISEFVKSKI